LTVRAYKFTAGDAVSVFIRFPWLSPQAGNLADGWSRRRRRRCARRAYMPASQAICLTGWDGSWEIELEGDVVKAPYKLVAPRGRLLRRVEGWPELERPFAEDCAARVQDLAVSELRRAELTNLAAAAASTAAEWAEVAEKAGAQAPPLVAALAGFALDCVWDVGKGYYAMCAYVAATASAPGRPATW
jgi:hypothetical protein